MTALEIVHILQPYQEYLIQLQGLEAKQQPQYEYSYSASLSYTFITLKLFRGAKDSTDKSLHIQIVFRIENNKIVFAEIFHTDKINIFPLTEEIKSNVLLHNVSFAAPQKTDKYLSDEITTSLATADRISQHGINMHSGDSYWPGNYSKINLTQDVIRLEQVNHMNSRSLNHKDDYSLRDLVFQIPIQNTVTLKQSYDDVFIGKMLISFSDRSTQNNREAGNAIQEQIKSEL
ncbi:hypothetical protein [Cytophaga aurantiaca]|uniref:hypothetical protein n=1 Tax=Cytophaga aurantiaca TaxID=29530 RepID=UPI0003800D19|nr:hypothetical protein [Cytophaga aurantiaca]